MRYSIYKSDTRKDDVTYKVKSFDDFFDCMNEFDSMVDRFLDETHPRHCMMKTRSTKNFYFEFNNGDVVEMFFMEDNN